MLPEPNVTVHVVLAVNPVPLTVRVEPTMPLGADSVIAGKARACSAGKARRSSDRVTSKPATWKVFLYLTSCDYALVNFAFVHSVVLVTTTANRLLTNVHHCNIKVNTIYRLGISM